MLQDHPLYVIPTIFSSHPNIIAAQSTRHGGFGQSPYSSLNLGLYTKDDINTVQANRDQFFEALGFSEATTFGAFQVHGEQVYHAEQGGQIKGYDAFITNKPGLLLSATIADCVPVLIFDAQTNSIAAIHAGWKGTVAKIVVKTLNRMQEQFGTKPEDCFAYIGTCIDACSFEVDEDVAQHFEPAFKIWDDKKGKYFVDLKTTNRNLLQSSGLPENQIEISPYCTVVHNDHFFSHRAEKGVTGRMLAVIGIKK